MGEENKKDSQTEQTEEDVKQKLLLLEQKRVQEATEKIQAICEEYGVMLQGQVVIPVSNIVVVPKRSR